MGITTGISWTDATWNPIRGCSRVSEGCRHCYAESFAYRFSGERLDGKPSPFEGLVQRAPDGMRLPKWNGKIKFVEEHLLDPLRWKKPRRIFVNSMSDLFHENVTDEMRDKIFAVMALCPQHTFQVLTKRPERMLAYLADNERYTARRVFDAAEIIDPEKGYRFDVDIYWPLDNVHVGVSVENQKAADERIPLLLRTQAAVRFISAEPLLGPVDLENLPSHSGIGRHLDSLSNAGCERADISTKLDWVIVGGESGAGARPMHPDWARSLRDQCKAAGVPYFFKQWGEWSPCDDPCNEEAERLSRTIILDCKRSCLHNCGDDNLPDYVYRVGTKAAGCLLDGIEHHEFPAVSA